jgi:hypothetical protein
MFIGVLFHSYTTLVQNVCHFIKHLVNCAQESLKIHVNCSFVCMCVCVCVFVCVSAKNRMCLHVPQTNLSLYQRGVYCMSVKIFDKLPRYIVNSIENKKQFVGKLKNLLTLGRARSCEDGIKDLIT